MSAKPYHFFQKAFCISRLLLMLCLAPALSAGSPGAGRPYGIIPSFIKTNSEQKITEVASNVLRVVNNTNTSVRFSLRLSVPNGWQMLRQNSEKFELKAGDSVFVPVRIIPDKLAKGNTNYVASVFLVSEQDVQFASQNWYITIQNQSEWQAALPVKKIYFVNNSDSSSFCVHFQNSGNSDENIHLSFKTDKKIDVIHPFTKEVISSKLDFLLPVGADTTLSFGARRRKEFRPLISRKEAGESSMSANETFTVQAIAVNDGYAGKPAQSWNGTVSFLKLGNEIRIHDFKRSALPLTVEMNAYDVLSSSTTLSMDAFGNAMLSDERQLNYRFQTVFITNFLNEKTFLGNNHYLGYFDSRGSFEAGDVSGWGRSFINGKGIKGSVKAGGNQFGAILTRSPYFFSGAKVNSYGFYHHTDRRLFSVSNTYSRISDDNLHQDNALYNSYASLKINRHHQLGFGGGYSEEDYHSLNSFTARGYGYDLNYAAGYNRFYLTLTDQFGSDNYTLARGLSMFTGRATYYVSKQLNVSLGNQNFYQLASYYNSGILLPGSPVRNNRYEARIGFLSQASAVYIKPAYSDEENSSLHALTKGLGLEYNLRNITNARLSATLYAGYVKTPDYPVPDFFISRIGANAKWKYLTLSARYFYGPNQASEQLRFVKDEINPQSINITSVYDYWFAKGNCLLSTNAGVMHETFFDKTSFRIRPEFFYYTKSGFRFSFYASYTGSEQGSNPLLTDIQVENGGFQKITDSEFNLGFGVRKQIGVPVPGKKFRSIRIIVFKDYNGNKIQDINEEGVENVLINMKLVQSHQPTLDSLSGFISHGDDFITNSKGEINYDNIPPGTYHIRIVPLSPLGEWFEGKEEDIQVDGKQTIYMSLNKGVKMEGSILLERDKYSNSSAVIDLSRIRVTAVDSSGKTYSSLTDKSGAFSMYLPNGLYTLTLNEAALGENFVCLQNRMVIDLTKPIAGNYSITFNVTERKREMKIKKFSSTSTELKQDSIQPH